MVLDERSIEVPGGKVWAAAFGDGPATPLIALHGGPGFSHHYLEPLTRLGTKRKVIFYDQLGCGGSDRPSDPSLWTVKRHVEELVCVLRAFGGVPMHVLGHSWGTTLAAETYFTSPELFKSIIFGSPCLSVPMWSKDAMLLRKKLPRALAETLDRCEANRDFFSKEYLDATNEFYRRFVYGMEELPECLKRSNAAAGAEVYTAMWGRNEFFVNGNLASYDCVSRLKEIKIPVWYFTGRNDEATPASTKAYAAATPTASLRIYERSAHHPHLTETNAFLSDLETFLESVDQGRPIERNLEAAEVSKPWLLRIAEKLKGLQA